jgi:hypothetical protein
MDIFEAERIPTAQQREKLFFERPFAADQTFVGQKWYGYGFPVPTATVLVFDLHQECLAGCT